MSTYIIGKDIKNRIPAKANMRFLYYKKSIIYSNVNDEEPIFWWSINTLTS